MTNRTSDLRSIQRDLIKLAAQLVRGEGVPDWSEHKFYRTTPRGEQREIMGALRDADEALRRYGIRLRAIADKLSAQITLPALAHGPTCICVACEDKRSRLTL